MTEENNNPEQKEPTLKEVQEIALKAAETAAEAKSKAEARENVATSVKEESEARGVVLSDEDCKKIADATIAGLEARGAFEEVEEANPPTHAPESASGDGTNPTPTPPESSPAPAAPPEQAPRKRTFAERFVGRK